MVLWLLQSQFKVWNSLYGYYGMCLKCFQQECMEGLSYGTQTAGMPCFEQFEGDSGNESVWDLVGSCSSSEWMS